MNSTNNWNKAERSKEQDFNYDPIMGSLPIRTMADVNNALRSYPNIAKEFAFLCAKHIQNCNNKFSLAAMKYAQRAKDCSQEDMENISEYAIMAAKFSLHAPVSGNVALVDHRDTDKRKKVIQQVEEGTAWQIRTLAYMLQDSTYNR